MGMGKWISGALGFMAFGPLGALLGYIAGAWLESIGTAEKETVIDEGEGRRDSFLFSMLVMASYIIRSDKRIMHSEMEFVRTFLRTNFGEQAVAQGEQILLRLFERAKQLDTVSATAWTDTMRDCGAQIAQHLTVEERLQLLDFLVKIAQSDGVVHEAEVMALREVTQALQLPAAAVDSMLHLEGHSLADAYEVLGITPEATDSEVRAAYRKLALAHHPDRVATLGEDVRQAAEKKFQQINNAKERIFKARGMK